MNPPSEMDINSIEEFLAHAHAMEQEAAEQYTDLAEQMDVHNNPEVAELFRKLAELEGKHVEKIDEKAGDREIPRLAPWDYKWENGVAPENPEAIEAHYMMTPHHAITMALQAEEKAEAFFKRVADGTTDDQVREMATTMAGEEAEHIKWLSEWLKKYPEPESGWDDDLDPPMLQE